MSCLFNLKRANTNIFTKYFLFYFSKPISISIIIIIVVVVECGANLYVFEFLFLYFCIYSSTQSVVHISVPQGRLVKKKHQCSFIQLRLHKKW